MRSKGKITSWDDGKGFGFITPLAGGKRIFVHISAFGNRNRRPEEGQVVTYSVSADKRGRPCVAQATLAGDRLSHDKKKPRKSLPVVGVAVFFGFVLVAVFTSKISPMVLVMYFVASLVTFLAYAFDKSAAKRGAWRTRESTLHLLSVIGGWPGAVVAQERLRHKSNKRSFRTVFWMTVFLNGCLFIWLLTPAGSTSLQSLIATII